MTERAVTDVLTAQRQTEGAGFVVRRSFPNRFLHMVDPFLLLDHMGPMTFGPGEGVGAPDHPHRGFETVTYMLRGSFEHHDSVGNHGVLGPGDVQWMTAGAGVVHSETPESGFNARGGTLEGVQLWVNLPAKDKMVPPRYQDTPASAIPLVELPDGAGTVRVIAGEAAGEGAVIDTRTPIRFLHVTLRPGGTFRATAPGDHNAFVYVLSGEGEVGGRRLREGQMGLLGDGDEAAFSVPADAGADWSALLITGRPIREPVARWGPFVMNTEAEIHQAVRDFQEGRLGRITATGRRPRVLVVGADAADLVGRLHGMGFDVQSTRDPADAERRLRAGVEALVVGDGLPPHIGDRMMRLAASTGTPALEAGDDLEARLGPMRAPDTA